MYAADRSGWWQWPVVCAVAGAIAAAAACGSPASPVTPTAPGAPPVVVNTAPTIQSVSVSGTRVEAGEEVVVTAVVTDAETPVEQLAYTWSAVPANGVFSGNGPVVKWRALAGQATPASYSLMLTVTEKYTSAGEAKENRVTSTPVVVHYNDSFAEVGGVATQFLTDFVTFSVSPEVCVRNFSDSCHGKQEELKDIQNNRANYHILGGTFGPQQISFDAARSTATVSESCTFRDIVNGSQVPETVAGTCQMTAVYEDWRWLLCTSRFNDGHITINTLNYHRR